MQDRVKAYEEAYRRYVNVAVERRQLEAAMKVVQAQAETDIINKYGGDEKALGSNQAARDRAMILELQSVQTYAALAERIEVLYADERIAMLERDVAEMELKVLVAQAGAPKTVFIR